MKTHLIRGSIALLLLALCQLPAAASTLTVRADSWMPYNGNPRDAKPGYVIELLKAIFEPQGVNIDYKTMPWNRALVDVETGAIDAVIGAFQNDVAGGVYPKEDCGISYDSIFVLAGNSWKYTDPASLKQLKLGTVDQYTYSDVLMAHIRANKGDVFAITGDAPLPKLVQMLQAGRISAFVETPAVGSYYLESVGLKDKIVSAGIVNKADGQSLYVAFSPKRPTSQDYAAKFDAGLRKLRQSGKLKEIMAKYGLKDWK